MGSFKFYCLRALLLFVLFLSFSCQKKNEGTVDCEENLSLSSKTKPFVWENMVITKQSEFSNLQNQTINVYGIITIEGETSWENCNFNMHNGCRIEVKPGTVLKMKTCHLFSDNGSWEGITVLNDGTNHGIVKAINCKIEDAVKAIQLNKIDSKKTSGF